jgi:hypothetical protein
MRRMIAFADLTIAIGLSRGLALQLLRQNAETQKNWTLLNH